MVYVLPCVPLCTHSVWDTTLWLSPRDPCVNAISSSNPPSPRLLCKPAFGKQHAGQGFEGAFPVAFARSEHQESQKNFFWN